MRAPDESARSRARPEASAVVVKLASRCNLSCDYCYFYNGADRSWAGMPRFISDDTRLGLIEAVRHLYAVQRHPPLIVFHGGEPLLYGVRRFLSLVGALIAAVPGVRLSVQTNGTIYNPELEAGLIRYRKGLTFSLSVDGFREDSDRHRVAADGGSRYERIEATIVQARAAGVLDGILMVLDPEVTPTRVFDFMIWAQARSYNILLRDGDHEALPPGKANRDTVEAGAWLSELFRLYAARNPPFAIEILDQVARAVLASHGGLRLGDAAAPSCVLTVDTDGEIKQIDTLRVNGAAFDRLTGARVSADGVEEALRSPENARVMRLERAVASPCRRCADFGACGGGYLQHRYRGGTYRNPSIYCADYRHLFSRVRPRTHKRLALGASW